MNVHIYVYVLSQSTNMNVHIYVYVLYRRGVRDCGLFMSKGFYDLPSPFKDDIGTRPQSLNLAAC